MSQPAMTSVTHTDDCVRPSPSRNHECQRNGERRSAPRTSEARRSTTSVLQNSTAGPTRGDRATNSVQRSLGTRIRTTVFTLSVPRSTAGDSKSGVTPRGSRHSRAMLWLPGTTGSVTVRSSCRSG